MASGTAMPAASATDALTGRHLVGSVKVLALTGGTLCRAARPERDFPDVTAVGTLE
jgi:hypothetical protein